MDDMDTSKYDVVQITEYQEMKAEIERLRSNTLMTPEDAARWAQANVDALGLLVKNKEPKSLRRLIRDLKRAVFGDR